MSWPCAGIKGIWNLQKSSSDSFDTYLVLAFVGETRILEINTEDELDEAEIEGFDADQQVQLTAYLVVTRWSNSRVVSTFITQPQR